MDPTTTIRTYVRFVKPNRPAMLVKSRDVKKLSLPDECEFYFYDTNVGVVNGVEYPFGPEINVSPHYFKVGEHFANPEAFRVYFMRCFGWDEDFIKNPQKWKNTVFAQYNANEFPNGVVIINGEIINPGKNGVIISAKKVTKKASFPTKKEIEAYRNYDD